MRPEIAQHIKDMDEAFGSADGAMAYASHFADDGVLYDVTAGETVTGRAAIAESLSAFTTALSPLTFQSTILADDGEAATVEWTATGKHTGDLDGTPPTGNTVVIHGVNLLRFTGSGKIAEERSFRDSGSLLRQLGLLDG